MIARLLLANGKEYEGVSVGADGTSYGEISFNTSPSGYQRILTDSSYSENIVVLTYPEIGNYGINKFGFENDKVFPSGLVMKNYCYNENHYLAEQSLASYLKNNGVVAISGIDTRELTTIIRDNGSMSCLITTEEITPEMRKKLKQWQSSKNLVQQASEEKPQHFAGDCVKIVVLDLGIKNSILKNLFNAKCDVTILPWNSSAKEILSSNPDAVLVSNGPGSPDDIPEVVSAVKELLGETVLFGVCLGSQVLAAALGANVLKLKYGHKGSNIPIINLETNKVFLTSQAHSYVIDEKSLPENCIVTYKNLNDDTVEGFTCSDYKIQAVQFHPEVYDENMDAAGVFQNWIEMLEGYKLCRKM